MIPIELARLHHSEKLPSRVHYILQMLRTNVNRLYSCFDLHSRLVQAVLSQSDASAREQLDVTAQDAEQLISTQ